MSDAASDHVLYVNEERTMFVRGVRLGGSVMFPKDKLLYTEDVPKRQSGNPRGDAPSLHRLPDPRDGRPNPSRR